MFKIIYGLSLSCFILELVIYFSFFHIINTAFHFLIDLSEHHLLMILTPSHL